MPSGLDYLRLARMGAQQQPAQPRGLADIGLAGARVGQARADDRVFLGETEQDRQQRLFNEYLQGLFAADQAAPSRGVVADPAQARTPILDPYAVMDQQDRLQGRQRTRRSF